MRGFVGGVESQAHVDAECHQIPQKRVQGRVATSVGHHQRWRRTRSSRRGLGWFQSKKKEFPCSIAGRRVLLARSTVPQREADAAAGTLSRSEPHALSTRCKVRSQPGGTSNEITLSALKDPTKRLPTPREAVPNHVRQFNADEEFDLDVDLFFEECAHRLSWSGTRSLRNDSRSCLGVSWQ